MPTSINDAISALMQLPTEARQKVGMMLHGLQPSAVFNQQMMAAAKQDPVGMVQNPKVNPLAGFLGGTAMDAEYYPQVVTALGKLGTLGQRVAKGVEPAGEQGEVALNTLYRELKGYKGAVEEDLLAHSPSTYTGGAPTEAQLRELPNTGGFSEEEEGPTRAKIWRRSENFGSKEPRSTSGSPPPEEEDEAVDYSVYKPEHLKNLLKQVDALVKGGLRHVSGLSMDAPEAERWMVELYEHGATQPSDSIGDFFPSKEAAVRTAEEHMGKGYYPGVARYTVKKVQ